MKNVSIVVILMTLSSTLKAQEIVIDTNYYVAPAERKQVHARRYLYGQFNEIQSWSISLEGGLRSDRSVLSNSMDGLISNATSTKTSWGIAFGYTYRNAWTVESGYVYAPVHLTINIANGSAPLVFTYLNNGNGIPLRVKRLLGATQDAKKKTKFWITGGGWLIPNGVGQTGDFKLIGYSYYGRNRVDTLRITNTTAVSSQVTGVAELGLEWVTRLTDYLQLEFYGRKYWGLGNALQSDLTYTVNNNVQQRAVITADGSGWGFGLALRYVYGRRYEIKRPGSSF